ncbi:CD209 antigen-like protein C [Elysia marginata]|uniref:CD209 antigen-like protein C n=1 Tax=Elysia marginata TaxID=1093978 RepID=A0AAV4I9S3_9GAST|nr:CD209 antigen-like protein C [Elysia marginata]
MSLSLESTSTAVCLICFLYIARETSQDNLDPCPTGWAAVTSLNAQHCLMVSATQETWSKARVSCQEGGGDLMVIKNQEKTTFFEKDFYKSFLRHISESYLWIGLNDIQEKGKFRWLDGREKAQFTSWMNGPPNIFRSEDVRCVGVDADAKWFIFNCTSKKYFICEKPPGQSPGEESSTEHSKSATRADDAEEHDGSLINKPRPTSSRLETRAARETHTHLANETYNSTVQIASDTPSDSTQELDAKDTDNGSFRMLIYGFWALCLLLSLVAMMFGKKKVIITGEQTEIEEENQNKTEQETENEEDEETSDDEEEDSSSSSDDYTTSAISELVHSAP